jgi:hypothetical protein
MYEKSIIMFLQIDGVATAVPLSEDESQILIDGELQPFKCHIEDGKSYVKLEDGRAFLRVNNQYE